MSRSRPAAARRRRPPIRPLLPLGAAAIAAALGGFALDASFPALGIWALAPVAVALSLVSLIGRRAGGALLVGLAFGAAFWFPHIDWSAQFLGDNPQAWVPWVALAGLQTVFTGLGAIPIALAYGWFPHGRWPRLVGLPLLVAALWTARELVTSNWPYGGFAWGRIGMSQSASPLAEVASWVGVTGLTFLIVLFCAAVIEVVRVRGRRLPALIPATATALILLLVPQWQTSTAGTLSVGAVQGNGPTAYFDEREDWAILRAQLEASEPLKTEPVDLVVWPEGGVDYDPLQDPVTAAELSNAARAYGAPILMNAASVKGEDVFNTSMLWTADGADVAGGLQTHAKRHPVPFGEYVPDRPFFEAIVPDLIGMIGREYTPGTDAPVVRLADTVVGLAICFDVIADDLIREGVRDGAQVFMFQTNNADFRGTDENLQQLAFARMRAIETGRTVVNLSTVGTSQIIAPDGATVSALGVDQSGLLVGEVELREGLTPGVVVGPAVQLMILWGAVLGLGLVAALHFTRPGSKARPAARRARGRSDAQRVEALFR
ncbi:apolipoprotein N-acyltransferase [Microbacterium paludicola]|uniref:Apolipoprotein N-acyltransferase n=1 Tax=Microbacterium paludicola TaxID=300019 RepID=A0A4Y9FY01_9MICO|nr:apolipoprotein N-acyltransferase [Microbacterium paludicola]MBF0816115.1 apolipoprotein N-acyltransferase [Microbacterium paludicola]TFU33176.1 apolipoprotein N-acyltransferase [Microbacterium paludicola]